METKSLRTTPTKLIMEGIPDTTNVNFRTS